MARGAAISVQNQFTKGLVTEPSVINFPENAVTDTDNCVYSELGPVSRRLGIDYEDSYQIIPWTSMDDQSLGDTAFIEFKWFFSTNDGTINFVVQQSGTHVNFFEVQSDGSLSAHKKTFDVDLTDYKVSTATIADVQSTPCSFSSGKGFLFIVHAFCEPVAVQYDDDADDITVTQITVEVRDFEGVEDSLDIDERPTTLSNLHKYNIWNQGWNTTARANNPSNDHTSDWNMLEYWDIIRNDFPSNADIFYLARDAFGFIAGNLLANVYVGNTPAPKGHFIYNAFNMDRSAETGISGLPKTTSQSARPSCTTFYAGRIFYGGISANGYSEKLYFSQIIESDKQFGRCYQVNDPTSEKNFDLLDSDGGEILLPQLEKIVALHVLGDSLIVLGTNGIFSIRGNDQGPFRATNYTVSLISTTGVLSPHSIVNADGNLLWINQDAMYALGKDQTGFSFKSQNLSKETIQSLISDIPSANRSFIKGVYNHYQGIVQWLYSDDEDITGYKYNRILEFNTISQAFYPYSISADSPYLVGVLSVSGQGVSSTSDDVILDNDDPVTTDSGDQVVINLISFVSNTEIFKYATSGTLSSGSDGFTYSTFDSTNYLDWVEYDSIGVEYNSYFTIGYRIRGDILKPTQVSPVEIVLKDDGTSEVRVHGIWDYGFRTTNPLYLYGPQRMIDMNRNWTRGSYRLRRCRFRGKGRSFQLKFESDGQKPFEVLGWSTFDTGGQMP